MEFARVGSPVGGSASSATFSGGNTVGNTILVCWVTNGTVATACNDTKGNTYARLATNVASTNKLAIFMTTVTAAGGSNTVTVSGGGTGFGTIAVEYSGKLASNPLDGTDSVVTANTATSIAFSIAAAVPGELMFGCVNRAAASFTGSLTGTSGFNFTINPEASINGFDNVNAASGTSTPTMNTNAAGSTQIGLLIGLKPATGNPNSLMLMGVGT